MRIAFITLLVFLATGSTTRSQTAPTSSRATINFCRLTETPRQFHNHIIRVKAILVMNHTPRVDGGDPFLYDVACAENNPYVVVQFSPNFKWNAGYTKLLRTQKHPDKFGNTRAVVTLVGQFQSSGQREYGHLDWADSQFVIYRIETVARVARRTIWPKGFNKSVRAEQIVGRERRERVS
jgi:hypothetical protein